MLLTCIARGHYLSVDISVILTFLTIAACKSRLAFTRVAFRGEAIQARCIMKAGVVSASVLSGIRIKRTCYLFYHLFFDSLDKSYRIYCSKEIRRGFYVLWEFLVMRFQHNMCLVVFVSTLISRICINTRLVCLAMNDRNVTNFYSQSPFQIILNFFKFGVWTTCFLFTIKK